VHVSSSPRRLVDQHDENAQDLQRVRPSSAQQDAQAQGEGEAEGRRWAASHVNDVWVKHGGFFVDIVTVNRLPSSITDHQSIMSKFYLFYEAIALDESAEFKGKENGL
jgi:hypothetical protein